MSASDPARAAARLLAVSPDELCPPDLRARIGALAVQGHGLVEEVARWADAARAAVTELNGGLAPLALDDDGYALVSGLTGASDLLAVASDLVDAAERLCAADPPPGGAGPIGVPTG